MLNRQILALVAVTFALLGGAALAIGGFSALAHDEESCSTPAADGAFMGLSDPNAPYDLRFIDEMVMHHQGAIMSSGMMIADADSEHPELRDLAQRIQEDQQRQIDQMLAWRAEWSPDAATPPMSMDVDAATPMTSMDSGTGSMGDMMGGNGMMGGMMGGNGMMGGMMDGNGMMGGMMDGMMDGEMADQMFLRMMIPHHQLAIEMAEDALVNAEHEELKSLAQEIIDGQSAEIEEMEGYLREWYDEESTIGAADDMRGVMQRMMGEC